MIATLHGSYSTWLQGDGKLLARVQDVPFPIHVVVCVCHGYMFARDTATGRLAIVR